MSELAQSGDRLRDRRERAAGAHRPEPQLRRAPARERDGVLLPRVRLRVLLSPLAEQRAPVAAEARRPVADARHARDGADGRERAVSCGSGSPTTARAAAAVAAQGAARARRRAARGRAPVRRVDDASASGPADGGYASVFIGWTAFNVLFVARHAVLAREPAGDGVPLPQDPSGAPRAGRGVGRPGPARRTTSPIRSRSSAGARGALLLLGVPRRARRPRLVVLYLV